MSNMNTGSTREYILEKNHGNVINVGKSFSIAIDGKPTSGNVLEQSQSQVNWRKLRIWLTRSMDKLSALTVIKYLRKQIDLKNMLK